MRLIATKADMYGPSASTQTSRTQVLNVNSNPSPSAVQKRATGVPVTQVLVGLKGSILAKPLTWLFGLVGLLIAYKLIEEHRGGKESFEEIKLGLNNVVKIGLVAMLFFIIARFLFTRYDVPGASNLVLYATGG